MEALLDNSDTSYGALEGAMDEPRKTSQKSELMFIAKSLGPLIITFILQFLLQTITMFACGHLGAEELAVASLALCSFNITAMAFYQGMSTCLDSFCSQAFGAGRPRLVGGILSAVLVDDAYFHSLSDVSDVVVLRCYIEVIGSLGGPRNAVPSFHEIVGFGGTWCTLFRSW